MALEYKRSIAEVFLEETYDRDELFAMSDWFVEEKDILFCSVGGGSCIRAERTQDGKWIIKDYWTNDRGI